MNLNQREKSPQEIPHPLEETSVIPRCLMPPHRGSADVVLAIFINFAYVRAGPNCKLDIFSHLTIFFQIPPYKGSADGI